MKKQKVMGSPPDTPDQEASVSSADEAKTTGFREHVASPDCWCCPKEIEPGLWEHFLPH